MLDKQLNVVDNGFAAVSKWNYMVEFEETTLGASTTCAECTLTVIACPDRTPYCGRDMPGPPVTGLCPSGSLKDDFKVATHIDSRCATGGTGCIVGAPTGHDIWVFAPDGRHLGMIVPPEFAPGIAFGDPDGRSLYMTASSRLARVRLNNAGAR